MPLDISTRLEALESSTASLLRSIEDLDDNEARAASLLPGWSRGHVLTHIARNADAMVNLVTWARSGTETPMYASRDRRDADIAAGADRSAAALRSDISESHERLLTAMAELSDEQWASSIRWGAAGTAGEAWAIPTLRRTEVEIHHVDLDLVYTLAHLPEDFVEHMLTEVTADFSRRDEVPGMVLIGNDDEGRWTVEPGGVELTGPPPSLLGYLLGRTDGVGLHTDATLPRLAAWR